MKNQASTKLIFFQPGTLTLLKQGSPSWPSHHRLWLLTFLSFFTLASLLTLLAIRPSPSTVVSSIATATATATASHSATATVSHSAKLPSYIFDALLHYASSNVTYKMPQADFDAVAAVLRRHSPCNLLVFGLGFESLLWRALNHNGRTVFIDENSYYISRFEERHKGVEAYDVQFATRVAEAPELLRTAREQARGDCRPVQNLLFSECRLGINDMPNQLYEVDWDVVIVDGPRGYSGSTPGRMSAIFTAGVLGRSRAGVGEETHVLVHDYEREVERVFSEEFLCKENMVAPTSTPSMAHFVIPTMKAGSSAFCTNSSSSSYSSTS